MLQSKYTDRFCCIVLVLMLLSGTLLINGTGLKSAQAEPEYKNSLFDTSYVHTIDIAMDDWDSFIASCTDEEYTNATLTVDGEVYKNVAIRAKGNTSLSSVAQYGNNRYSFKVEFDHYTSSATYKGLDKLCLNNIIQDATYLKDYICYTLMSQAGVDTPLCSFVWITVNGSDWGLYLAVEGVEDSFLKRIGASSSADLYKPDSNSFGGGRGNGMGFNMDDFNQQFEEMKQQFMEARADVTSSDGAANTDIAGNTDVEAPAMPGSMPTMPGSMSGNMMPTMPENTDGEAPAMPDNISGSMPASADGEAPTMPGSMSGNMMPTMPGSTDGETIAMPNNMVGGFGMGSDDVKLIYTDDDPESYSNIFDNAKTNVTDKDKQRLINALKQLSEGNVETCVDIEKVITYMAVHNFVVNADSYTGSMVHNYYLLDQDGVLSMIPWDYNLAFGGFSTGSTGTSAVNAPIDTLAADDRPMAVWITSSDEYIQKYHDVYSSFISEVFESGLFEEEFDRVFALIAPYVQKDPTAFYDYEQFTTAASLLKTFCLKRAQSVRGQLDGTIPSTEEGQSADATALIDASEITLSAMGSNTAAIAIPEVSGTDGFEFKPDNMDIPSQGFGNGLPPEFSGEFSEGTPPDSDDTADAAELENPAKEPEAPSNAGTALKADDGNRRETRQDNGKWLLAASAALLALGLIAAVKYPSKRL